MTPFAKIPFSSSRRAKLALIAFFTTLTWITPNTWSTVLKGRVVNRATITPYKDGKGLSGVRISVFDQQNRLVKSATTDAKGQYTVRNLPPNRYRVDFTRKGFLPGVYSHVYALTDGDTLSRNVYLDGRNIQKGIHVFGDKGSPGSSAFYDQLADGILALAHHPAFFRHDRSGAFGHLGNAFDAEDSSQHSRELLRELLWWEIQNQDRPEETKIYIAHALDKAISELKESPSGKRGTLRDMKRYLAVRPESIEEFIRLVQGILVSKTQKLSARDLKKLAISDAILVEIVAPYLNSTRRSRASKLRLSARLKKAWGGKKMEKYFPASAPSEPQKEKEPEAGLRAFLESLIPLYPRNAALRYQYALCLISHGDGAQAVTEFEQAVEADKDHPSARYHGALYLLEKGRDVQAADWLSRLSSHGDPLWRARAWNRLARIAEKKGDFSEALATQWKAVRTRKERKEDQKEDTEMILNLARISMKAKQTKGVEKLLKESLQKYPDLHGAHYWLGKLALEQGQQGLAEMNFHKARDKDPSHPEYAEALATLLHAREEYGAAAALLAPASSHLSPHGRLLNGECLMRLERPADAEVELSAAHAALPGPKVLCLLAESRILCGKAPQAISLLEASPLRDKTEVRFALAKARIRNKENESGRALLKDLASEFKGDADYQFYLGLCFFQEEKYSQAKKAFERALKFRQDHMDAVYHVGLSFLRTKKANASRNYFKELSQHVKPTWKSKGFLGLGQIFALEGKYEAAEHHFSKSLAARETAEAAGRLAMVCHKLKKMDAAEKWATKAMLLDASDPEALAAGELFKSHRKAGGNRQKLPH